MVLVIRWRNKKGTLVCLVAFAIQSLGYYGSVLPQISEKAQGCAPIVWLNEMPNETRAIASRPLFQSFDTAVRTFHHIQYAIAHPLKSESIKYCFLAYRPAHYPFITIKQPTSQFTADL